MEQFRKFISNTDERHQWMRSWTISLFIFVVFSFYLYIRRGYYNLYIINKVLGSSAAILAGFTLIVGPLSKRIKVFTSFLPIKRHLGLIALYFAIAHIVASLVQLERFPFPDWYLEEWIPVTFGIATVAIWVYMKYLSSNDVIKKLGIEVWKKRLSIGGKIAFISIFFHLVVMKYQGWIRWFQGEVRQTPQLAHPSYPPASLFVFFILSGIIMYRIYTDHIRKKDD